MSGSVWVRGEANEAHLPGCSQLSKTPCANGQTSPRLHVPCKSPFSLRHPMSQRYTNRANADEAQRASARHFDSCSTPRRCMHEMAVLPTLRKSGQAVATYL